MISSPCYKCDKRNMLCHTTCLSYTSYLEDIASKRLTTYEQRLLMDDFYRSLNASKKASIKYHRGDVRFH